VKELEAIANGADGTAARVSDLRDGHFLHAIEAKDSQEAGRLERALRIEPVQQRKGGADGL